MIKARIRSCICRVENILTLGKLLRLWFCFLLHSILFFISHTPYHTYKIISSYELARPIMETIFLVIIIIVIFFIQVFSECIEMIATSLIPLVTNFPEICDFLIGFSFTVWTKVWPLLAH